MKSLLVNLGLAAASLLVALGGAEIALRLHSGEYRFENFLKTRLDLFRSAYPAEFDADLGWVPRQGASTENVWGTRVTIGPDGIRSNGASPSPTGPATIVAVGDSFTFGDQVSDHQTWPAALERMSGHRVLNGGVFGYGLDQSFLRLRQLTAKYRPDAAVFSFIPDNVRRCELSERTSARKPYFELTAGGELALRNDHLRPPPPSTPSLGPFKDVMGYSLLAHKLMSRALPGWWVRAKWRNTRAHSQGPEVACRILAELGELSRRRQLEIYVLVQVASDQIERRLDETSGAVDLERVISCVDTEVLQLVDLRARLGEIGRREPERYSGLYDGHMTAAGNELVASLLWDAMRRP